MISKPKILILFEGVHLAYSPTTIQLYEALYPHYDVEIFAKCPEGLTNQILPDKKVVYYKYITGSRRYIYRFLFKFLKILNIGHIKYFSIYGTLNYFEYMFRFRVLNKILKKNRYHRIICIDHRNLFFCSLLNIKCDFISLELCYDENLFRKSNLDIINSVIIQSQIRYEYLFGKLKKRVFYIQNAPVYREFQIPEFRSGLIFTGTAFKAFGIQFCLDFIKQFKSEKLYLFGNVPKESWDIISSDYSHLIDEGRLIISTNYLSSDELFDKLLQFEIGFCLYDFSDKWVDNFNYQTAPSGKLFKYLSAGIPVIANDVIGFQFVKEYKCGELVSDLKPDYILKAVESIRNNYKEYASNAKKIAVEVSFDKNVKPYIELLLKS